MVQWNGDKEEVLDIICNYMKNFKGVEIMPNNQGRIVETKERGDGTMEFVCSIPRYRKISFKDNYDHFILQIDENGEAYNPMLICNHEHNNNLMYNKATSICSSCEEVMCMFCQSFEINDKHKHREEFVCRSCYSKWVYGKTTGLAISIVAGVVLMIYSLLLGSGIGSIGMLFWPFMLRYWQFMIKGFFENEFVWIIKAIIWVIISGLVSIIIIFPAYQCIIEIKERMQQINELKADKV